jgi:hypothetical protein|tara:strand:- start:17423 stop:18100 length:678 start_codon:yes stop_codon:yes gene_type:complete
MYQDFYRDGVTEIKFESEQLNEVLKKIINKEVHDGFELKTKYSKTFDLRPDVISYHPVFMNALKENNIKDTLKKITLRDLSLFHVQVRLVKDEKSYMNWHRDTYYNQNGDLIGQAPHGVKIIYYPNFSNEDEDRLLYLKGSNRILFPNNAYDNQLFKILHVEKIKSRNNTAVLFDTNGLHAVVPEKPGKKSIRLIYNFLEKSQIDMLSKSPDDIHQQTSKLYDDL